MKACIVCQKVVQEHQVTTSDHDFLGVCTGCEPWYDSNTDLIAEHREKLLSSYSSGVKATFLQKKQKEQHYITIRSLELVNKR